LINHGIISIQQPSLAKHRENRVLFGSMRLIPERYSLASLFVLAYTDRLSATNSTASPVAVAPMLSLARSVKLWVPNQRINSKNAKTTNLVFTIAQSDIWGGATKKNAKSAAVAKIKPFEGKLFRHSGRRLIE